MQQEGNNCYLRTWNVYSCFLNDRVIVEFIRRKTEGWKEAFERWEKKGQWPREPKRLHPIRESWLEDSRWIFSNNSCPVFSVKSPSHSHSVLYLPSIASTFYTGLFCTETWLGNDREEALLVLEEKKLEIRALSRNSEKEGTETCVFELLGKTGPVPNSRITI